MNSIRREPVPFKTPRIWIVVADRFIARIFKKRAIAPGFEEIISLKQKEPEMSGWLDNNYNADKFDRLVLIALPGILVGLREVLSTAVGNLVVAEVNKELTGLSEADLQEALAEIVWF